MIILDIITWFTLGIITFLFASGIFVLKNNKSKILSAVFTFGLVISMLDLLIKTI